MRAWALVPVRSLATGKSRLSGVLDDSARRRLNEALLARVLAAAAEFPGIRRAAVISGCPGALACAAAAGALPLPQTGGESGPSAAVAEGVRRLRSRGARSILVVVADLPLVLGEDLREIAALGRRAGQFVVCADKHGTGTNALYLPGHETMPLRFGPDSCAAHLREGERCGIGALRHFNPRVACDVDTPDDLRCLSHAMPLARWVPGARAGAVSGFRADAGPPPT